jgi:hypothetical protein
MLVSTMILLDIASITPICGRHTCRLSPTGGLSPSTQVRTRIARPAVRGPVLHLWRLVGGRVGWARAVAGVEPTMDSKCKKKLKNLRSKLLKTQFPLSSGGLFCEPPLLQGEDPNLHWGLVAAVRAEA